MTEFKFRDKKFIIFGDIFLYNEKCYNFIPSNNDNRFLDLEFFYKGYNCNDKERALINGQYRSNQINFPNEKYKFKTDDFEALADGAWYFTACLAGTENAEFLLKMVRWVKGSPLYLDKKLFIIDPLTSRYNIPEIVLDEFIFNDYPVNIKSNFADHPSLKEKHLIYLSKIPSNTIAFNLLYHHNISQVEIFENLAQYQPELTIKSLLLSKETPQYLREHLVQTRYKEKDEFKKLLEDDAAHFGLKEYRTRLLKASLSNLTNQLLMRINDLNSNS
jgi:hypothetical protein